ncbi:porin [Caballeronia udeis]|uniref:Porin n=1 Tax=Caballeronia udeis TaxID=1232866 RepID=A0A158JQS3_9BURK|nr:porin [Caballeronia udeis]
MLIARGIFLRVVRFVYLIRFALSTPYRRTRLPLCGSRGRHRHFCEFFMKRTVAASALVLCISAAHAQSSVSLYGIIDEGFEAISNAPVAGSNGGGRLSGWMPTTASMGRGGA